MKFWKRRPIRITAALIAALILIQFGTYFAYAQNRVPVVALRQLHDLKLLKGHDFVLVDEESWNAMTPDQRSAFNSELLKYVPTAYHALSEVPEGRVQIEPITQKDRDNYERWKTGQTTSPQTLEFYRRQIESGRKIMGYKNGWKLEWKSGGSGLFWMQSEIGYQSEGSSGLYVWVLGFWLRVRDDGGWIT